MLTERMIQYLVVPCVLVLMAVSVISVPNEARAEEDQVSSEEAQMYQSLLEKISKTKIHGFLSQGFIWSSDNDYLSTNSSSGDFRFNEVGLTFTFPIQKKLRVGMQLFSRSFGSMGNNEVQLDWAFADYRHKDGLGFRAGKIRTPMGFYNETRDIDALRANIFMPESVYSQFERDFTVGLQGIGIYGHLPTAWDSTLSYQVQWGVPVGGADSNVKKILEEWGFIVSDYEVAYSVVGSLIWSTPLDGLRVGGTIQWWDYMSMGGETGAGIEGIPPGFPFTIKANDYIVWVGSIEYTNDDVTLAAEFKRTTSDIDLVFWNDDMTQEGCYLSLSYCLTDSWYTGINYSIYWSDATDRKGSRFEAKGEDVYRAWQQDFVLSLRHDIFQDWIVKLEGHFINGSAHVSYSSSDHAEQNWFLGAVKTSYAF